ncbi:MAG: hypothetical protein WDN25_10385 [Acetobacteraceae bacterium]
MAGLDDAGMDGADRDLVQPVALHRQERIGGGIGAVIEPRAGVRQALGHEPEQVVCRALQPDRRRMQRTDRGIAAVRAVQRQQHDRAVEHRHVDAAGFAPQAQQRHLARSQRPRHLLPVRRIDNRHPSSAATCWNQATSGAGSQMPAISTSVRCANIGT